MTSREVQAGGAPLVRIREGAGPILGVALHAGHALRPGLLEHLVITDSERLREEDPFTAEMLPEELPLLEVLRSRFEVDLNRPRFRAVYQGPQDSWGLRVYRRELPDAEDRISRAAYDVFYATLFDELAHRVADHGRVVVLDLHSYNHRRGGPGSEQAESSENPEVNLGTRNIDRERWAPVADALLGAFREAGYDIRENVKFGGGHLSHWTVEEFGESVCPLAIEFKKTYVDEWTGVVDHAEIERARATLAVAADRVRAALVEVR